MTFNSFPLIPWTSTPEARQLQESARYLVAEGESETVYFTGGLVERALKVGDFYWKEGALFPLRLVTEVKIINNDEEEPYSLIWTVMVNYRREELQLPFAVSYTDYYGQVHKLFIRKSWWEKGKTPYVVYFEDGEFEVMTFDQLMRYWAP